MGLLAKLFRKKRPAPSCPLEAYIAGLDSASMNAKLRTIPDELKAPTAQAWTVLVACGGIAGYLRSSIEDMPEFMRSELPFSYEKVVTEAAGFFFYTLIRDYLGKPAGDDEDWDDDEEKPAADARFESLKLAMHICGALLSSLTDKRINEKFVGGRAVTYSDLVRRGESVVESLEGFLMRLWDPKAAGRPSLELTAPMLPIQAAIVQMPFEALQRACAELYDTIAKNPKAH